MLAMCSELSPDYLRGRSRCARYRGREVRGDLTGDYQV